MSVILDREQSLKVAGQDVSVGSYLSEQVHCLSVVLSAGALPKDRAARRV
ncbi:hypothetical protein [Mycolicibacterium wolinskyi]